MNEEVNKENIENKEAPKEEAVTTPAEPAKEEAAAEKQEAATPAVANEQQKDKPQRQDNRQGAPRGKGGPQSKRGKPGGKRRSRHEQAEQASEFTEKVVQVRRVTKVVKGGKKLSFRTTVIIGNEKGKVGIGVGKASEVLIAIKKAIADARKNLIDVETVKNTNTISHVVYGEAGGSRVLLKPAAEGTGIIAGGTARIVLELAGVGDILAKSKGSKSPLNVARATIDGLKQLRGFEEVASLRGMSVKKMLFAS